MSRIGIGIVLLLLGGSFMFSCGSSKTQEVPNLPTTIERKDLVEGVDYFLPHINLNNWKVTLPIGNPTEVEPPEILDYANMELLKPFMYNDSTDGSIVF